AEALRRTLDRVSQDALPAHRLLERGHLALPREHVSPEDECDRQEDGERQHREDEGGPALPLLHRPGTAFRHAQTRTRLRSVPRSCSTTPVTPRVWSALPPGRSRSNFRTSRVSDAPRYSPPTASKAAKSTRLGRSIRGRTGVSPPGNAVSISR